MRLKSCSLALALVLLPASSFAQDASAPETRQKMRAACGADVQKFCANIERAKGAMRTCLQANEAQYRMVAKQLERRRAAARAKEKS